MSAPAAAFVEAKAKGNAFVEAELPQDLRTPGRHGPASVRISVVGLAGPDVAPRQTSVMATVDIRDADERAEIKSVPVRVSITQELNESYRVTYQPKFVLSVPVYGSPDRIQQLKSGEIATKPEAVFGIYSADIAARQGTRKLDYILPEGISIREEDKKEVTFEVVPRDGVQ